MPSIIQIVTEIYLFSVCNYTLSSTSTYFSSPGYPNGYPPNTTCQYHFNVPENKVVALLFSRMFLKHSSSCVEDSIKIYYNNVLQRTLCGYNSNLRWLSNNSDVLMVFKSDSAITSNSYYFYGYLMQYNKRKSGKFTHNSFIFC